MRAANRNRLASIAEAAPADADWKQAAGRRVLQLLIHDGHYAELARKSHLVGTPPQDAKRYATQAKAYLVDLCRRHGEDRYADLMLAESSDDTN